LEYGQTQHNNNANESPAAKVSTGTTQKNGGDMIEQRLFTFEQTETTSDDYYTPKWIFDTLKLHFDLDVASPPHATNVPCDRYFTQADDGLAQDWHGRVFMNPPFSKPRPWVERWLEHSNGVALLPTAKSNWFTDTMWRSNAKIAILPSNMKFSNGSILYCCALWAIGDDNIEALRNFGTVR
jgi:phage N-6-adenine-methyltransferase